MREKSSSSLSVRCLEFPFAIFAFVMGIAFAHEAWGQGSRADYERSAGLARQFSGKVFRNRVDTHWLPGDTQFWYKVSTGKDTFEFVRVDAEKGERKPAFDHMQLAQALHSAGLKDVRSDRLPVCRLEWTNGALEFVANGRRWGFDEAAAVLTDLGEAGVRTVPSLSPDAMPQASRGNGEGTSLNFINQTEGEIGLFWLDAAGKRQGYGKLAPGAHREQHTFAGHVWIAVDGVGKTLAAFAAVDEPASATITSPSVAVVAPAGKGVAIPNAGIPAPAVSENSPDRKWRAFVRANNVVLKNIASGEETTLTTDGNEGDAYRARFYWAPDSAHFVALRVEKGQERKVYAVESSPREQLQPRLLSFDYLKPGDKLPHPRPVLFEVDTKRRIPVSDALFPNPFSERGWLDVRWEPDSLRFTFRYNQRGHQVLRIVGVDARTGEARAVVDERSATFIDYTGKNFLHWLDTTGELIWMSERDGWNHLYLYDAKMGTVKNQITKGEWVVRGVDRVDTEKRQIWFSVGGIVPGQDPYFVHYARVNFDGTGLTLLTEGDGSHSPEFSPDRRFVLDSYSRVDLAPITELRRAEDGTFVCTLESADMSALAKAGWKAPERFVAKGRDGVTDIYGVIVRPTHFDPLKRYPVIEHIYAGPQGAFTPKTFSVVSRMQELAELGFIVVQMDGMGTSQRSKSFHDVCWKNLGDGGFPDRILWIKSAAARYPEMDVTRVGIYGTSAGGQNALGALLTHGEFYKAGVSDCGCHDNRMDKIWWNEQWMGWPVDKHYDEQSNVSLAKNLQGKLLLMVGEMDKNVDPASTMQVCNALIKAGKDYELLVVPGAGHGVAGMPYGQNRLQGFFVRTLLNREPRW